MPWINDDHSMIRRVVLLAALLLMTGCFSNKDTILPQDGPTMLEIYQGHFAGDQPYHKEAGSNDEANQHPTIVFGQRAVHADKNDLAGISRNAADQLDQRFARLPNPTLILYVYPHLGADNQYPIPGYSTAFPLYEQVFYALPGEVETQP